MNQTSISCRSCQSKNVAKFLDLGLQPLANNLLKEEDLKKDEPKFPLEVAVCKDCWLVQITETIPPVAMFSDYVYFSSFSDEMLRHSAKACEKYIANYGLNENSFVVEIASNDGYLLKNFVAAKVPCLGVEPAKNIAEVAEKAGVPTLCEFFGVETAKTVVQTKGQADLILGNNVFAHAPDINDFIGGLATLLKPEGRIALEFPYLGNFIDHIEFDTVYHEHVFYFSALALAPAFERHGLKLVDIELLPIHGGSLRLYAEHANVAKQSDALLALLEKEKADGLATEACYENFAKRVSNLKAQLLDVIAKLKSEGHSIAAYGASAKGSTLVNYFGIGKESLDFIVDRSTYKQGKFSPGMHIPILAPEHLLTAMPDYTLLLTWNFANEILAQQQEYRNKGGKFIIPLPVPKIV